MTDTPAEMQPDCGSGGDSAEVGEESSANGAGPTILELAIYLPVGLASLAREAIERLIAEGAARGEVEVGRLRNAVENELEIARSVGRARVRATMKRSSRRFEYPPLSILAEAARLVAETSREALDELQAAIGATSGGDAGDQSLEGAAREDEPADGAIRGRGLAHLKSAQRTAASRVLKARFGREQEGIGAEVVKVDFVEEPEESESETAPAEPVPPPKLEDYDSLSAQQVVARLGGLSDEELRGLLAYESATRSRAAVIERVRRELESRESS